MKQNNYRTIKLDQKGIDVLSRTRINCLIKHILLLNILTMGMDTSYIILQRPSPLNLQRMYPLTVIEVIETSMHMVNFSFICYLKL